MLVTDLIADEPSQRILVIDDDTTQRILVKEYLEEAGYSVRLSDDGSRGLKMASKFKPDLIILDWMLPSLDGYTLCTCLKQQEATAGIPIILITASRDPDVIERGLSAGADDFVTKPVDWVFLADRVANVLEKSRQQAAITRQLQTVRRSEEDTAQKFAAQSEQLQAEFDARLEAIEAEAAHEIHLAKDAARLEAEAALLEVEAGKAEIERALAEARRTAEGLAAQLASVRDEYQITLRERELAARAEREAAATAHARSMAALEAAIDGKVCDALAAAEGDRNSFKSAFESKLSSCWNLAHIASVHHRDLAFRLMSMTQVISTDPGLARANSAVVKGLDEVLDLARTLADSIGSLNLLSQVMAGKAELKENAFDLAQMVADAAAKFAPICEQRRIAITSRIPRGTFLVTADQARLTYALASLIINATRFTPQGGAIKLTMEELADGSIEVSVADTGIGVAPAELDSLRNCLDQPWKAVAKDGYSVGYGIPIATALVRQHGGHLDLVSNPGQGTVAKFVIPAGRRQSEPGKLGRSPFRNAS